MRQIVGLVIVLIIGFVVWQALSGTDATVPDAPDPDLPIPDNPGEAADSLWNTIDNAPQWVWTQAAPILIVGILLARFAKKFPKLSFSILGATVMFFFLVVVLNR